jgi:hypothetical protein
VARIAGVVTRASARRYFPAVNGRAERFQLVEFCPQAGIGGARCRAAEARTEVGMDISQQTPKVLTIEASDVVITLVRSFPASVTSAGTWILPRPRRGSDPRPDP